MAIDERAFQAAKDGAAVRLWELDNCAETTLTICCEALGIEVTPAMRAMTLGLAGYGGAGGICGALAGAGMVVSLSEMEPGLKGERDNLYRLSRKVYKQFVAKFGSGLCGDLNPTVDTQSPEQRAKCTSYVVNAVEFALRAATEKQSK